jgi:hypothetical protein
MALASAGALMATLVVPVMMTDNEARHRKQGAQCHDEGWHSRPDHKVSVDEAHDDSEREDGSNRNPNGHAIMA